MDLQAVDQPLWAFVDPEGNRDVAGFPLIIPVHGGAYLDVAKTVRAVEVRDRLLILAAEGFAVTAMPQIEGGRLDEQRSEEHTSELQSRGHLVCRLLLE